MSPTSLAGTDAPPISGREQPARASIMSRPGAQVIAASWPMLVVLTSPRLQQNAARSKTQTPSSFARLPGATTSARKLSTRRMELGRRYRPPPT